MKTWYLVNDLDQVWMHHKSGHTSCGQWAHDFDAEYKPEHFAYRNKKTAESRLDAILKADRRTHPPLQVSILDREALFQRLDVEDWAYAYLNDQPDPAEEKRKKRTEATRLKREAAKEMKAARKRAGTLAPAEHMTPVVF